MLREGLRWRKVVRGSPFRHYNDIPNVPSSDASRGKGCTLGTAFVASHGDDSPLLTVRAEIAASEVVLRGRVFDVVRSN